MITYDYAVGDNGVLVNIADITRENRTSSYYCVGCGEEMSVVLGSKREHHFRHKNDHCSRESYLHKLGKRLLRKRFYTQKEFKVYYYADYICNNTNECIFNTPNCNRRALRPVDLKEFYDTCEEEVCYNGFRADLMLSNSMIPERKPVFIEISVTHDCEPEKLVSGIRIVEVKIFNEKDLLCPLLESDRVRFYNFKRQVMNKKDLYRFWVERGKNNILQGYRESVDCRSVREKRKDGALYEFIVDSSKEKYVYAWGMINAFRAGVAVRDCRFCRNRNNPQCRSLVRNRQTSHAAICKFYSFDSRFINKCERELCNTPYIEY